MTTATYQIAGRSPFPLITDFLAYAIERQTMKDPMWVNLQTSDEIRAAGHQAECRDTDGHLTRTHAPPMSDEDIVWLVREALEHGDTVTIWPVADAKATAMGVSHG